MMKIYPSNLDISKIRPFRDKNNNIKYLVGKEEDFENMEKFKLYLVEIGIKCKIMKLSKGYARYYPILSKKVEYAYIEGDKIYGLCKKGRGAFKVYKCEIGE